MGGIALDVTERERIKTELQEKNEALEAAIQKVQLLEKSIVTMCAWTRRVKMDGRWVTVEEFLERKLGVRVSHGISEDAYEKLKEEFEAEQAE